MDNKENETQISKTPKFDALPEKHKMFVKHFMVHHISTQAYMESGYEKYKGYAVSAYRLRHSPDVSAAIDEMHQLFWDNKDQEIKNIFAEKKRLAYSDIKNLFDISEDGIRLKDLEEIDTSVVKKIKIRREPGKMKDPETGERAEGDTIFEIELFDKNAALDSLADYTQMKKEQNNNFTFNITMDKGDSAL
jgi:hypothetical protein